MELHFAVLDEDTKAVKSLLRECSTKAEVDCPDERGRTAFMAAARGNGSGGRKFFDILQLFWNSYMELGCSGIVLEETDDKHKWNLFMHSAKCGDIENLKLVLSFYQKMGRFAELQESIDWAHVDHRAKQFVSDEVFDGAVAGISNYASTRRATRSAAKLPKGGQGDADKVRKSGSSKKRVSKGEKGSGTRSLKKKRNSNERIKEETEVKEEAYDGSVPLAVEGDIGRVKREDEMEEEEEGEEDHDGGNVIEIGSDDEEVPAAAAGTVPVTASDPPVARAPPAASALPPNHAVVENLRRERDLALAKAERISKAIQALTSAGDEDDN